MDMTRTHTQEEIEEMTIGDGTTGTWRTRTYTDDELRELIDELYMENEKLKTKYGETLRKLIHLECKIELGEK